ncbi:Chorismate synthase [Neolecta irregularis DAH-3]|uniref:chorismate synthase n=1 Tax=Neolecta irregularis (strain DAH-3) TaxID=1198029 RepID=A0A1U7LP50_NEOID|nr:Chorismate synthase [Neolecta irregularis DAH-3]|eukprot:OLL24322.1 Chorismate synthase [Neolecta irregularis DAH-3]
MSSFGTLFKVTTYGESHCKSVGCIVENVPPGLDITEADIQPQLSRRRPGQSDLTTARDEKDRVEIQSGTEFGVTLGTPIGMVIKNQDQRPHDYSEMDDYPRPSHADLTYLLKYGVKASSGGGRSSARETIGRVAAGAIAEKYLYQAFGIEIVGFVSSVGTVHLENVTDLLNTLSRVQVDQYPTRCPDTCTSEKMTRRILEAKANQDSIGGTVTCVIRNAPSGLGEPCFDKLEAKLAHAMLSIPATKAFEIGSGFGGCQFPGSQHNDVYQMGEKGLTTFTNNSGGVQGGISNGEHIYFKVGFKSPATIGLAQKTASYAGVQGELKAKGRHDPCVVPRAVPIVEAMAAMVIMEYVIFWLG